MPKRILFARTADAAQLNAQAKNAQHILRYWQSPEWRPTILACAEPDAGVAVNPNVEILNLPDGRTTRVALFLAYLRRFDAIFYPGAHHMVDWLALRTRAAIGSRLPVISTMESLAGRSDDDSIERWFADRAGHDVRCGLVPPGPFGRYEEIQVRSDHIIAISPFLARMAAARYGDKVSMLPLGVDTKLFGRGTFRRGERPRVVCAGTVYARKRPELFVALATRFPQADFTWFGEGGLRQSMIEEGQKAGLSNLQFPGARPPEQIAEAFATSDIFVLPSLAEGVPKASQEAAAAGLAQIIFGHYESPSVIDGVNGYVVWSDEALFERLDQLLHDADLVETMGRRGQAMAQDWSWAILAPQWEQRIIDIAEMRLG